MLTQQQIKEIIVISKICLQKRRPYLRRYWKQFASWRQRKS